MKTNEDYKTIRLPKPLIEKIDKFLQTHPEYVSRSDIIKEAIRMHIREEIKK